MSKHAKFSPSSAGANLACPGRVAACEGLPDKTSKYAMEGSIAHRLCERCLKRGDDAEVYLGHQGGYTATHECVITKSESLRPELYQFSCVIDEDMREAVQVYLDEIRRVLASSVGATFHVERSLSLEWLVPHVWGTSDHTIVEPLGRLHVADYKHGRGVAVEAVNNAQMRAYGLMAMGEGNPQGVEEVLLKIIQPRAPHSAGRIRYELMPIERLIEWGHDVLVPGVAAAFKPDAPRIPGDYQCKGCRALAACPEARKESLKAARVMFDDNALPIGVRSLPDPRGLTGEQLDRFLAFLGMFKDMIKAVEGEAYARLQNNSSAAPTAMKLVKGRGSRGWKESEEEVKKKVANILAGIGESLDGMYTPKKLKTVAQMEKTLKKVNIGYAAIKNLVEKTTGKNLMVPVGDSRPAVKSKVSDMFGDDGGSE